MAETQYSTGQESLPRDSFYADILAERLPLAGFSTDYQHTRAGLFILHCARYGNKVIGILAEDHTQLGTPVNRLLSRQNMNGRPLTQDDANALLAETKRRIAAGQILPSRSIDAVARQE